jgi:protease I
MASIVFFVAPVNYRDEELQEPKDVMEAKGIYTVVASIGRGTARGKLGGTANCELGVNEIDPNRYEGIIFVGGPGVIEQRFPDNPAVIQLAQKFAAAGKVVAAICVAPRILAKAGLLNGKKATVFNDPESITLLQQAGAKYSGKDVEVDGKIVTANGPTVAKRFGERVAALVK